MISYNSYGENIASIKKQKGATLMTSLVFLVLMTVVSVSATKVSIMDLLVSGNNQQEMMLYQDNENQLKLLAEIGILGPILNANPDDPTIGNGADVHQFIFDDVDAAAKGHALKLSDYSNGGKDLYTCSRNGAGTSLGPNALKCRLFDFEVNSRVQGTSTRNVHHKGTGKAVPNPNKGAL